MRALAIISAGFALSLSSCRERAAERDRPIEIDVPTDVATLDPRYATRSLDIKLSRLIHAGLIGLDPDSLEPIPLVARRWTRRDSRTLEVELKPGLRFHGGQPLDANDVCATLGALAEPALASPHRAVVRAIGSCVASSALTLTLRLNSERASLLTDLEVPILQKNQVRAKPSPFGTLAGLGPYRVVASAGGEVRLEPAATGLFPKPAHAAVVRTVRDENARALRLLAGRADIVPNAISATLLPALDQRSGLAVHARRGANVTYLLMQNDRAPWNRKAVRRAVSLAIDRSRIVETLFDGHAEPATSIFPSGHWSNPGASAAPIYDPRAARPALEGIGEVTLLTSTERARITLARAMAQMLASSGLRVRVVPLDLGVVLSRLDSGDFDLATLQMPELTEPNLLKWFFHPRAVPGEGGEGKNRARYRSPRAAWLLDRASETTDTRVRRELYQEFSALMAEDMPVVPLWHEDQIAVVSARASGFALSAEGRWTSLALIH